MLAVAEVAVVVVVVLLGVEAGVAAAVATAPAAAVPPAAATDAAVALAAAKAAAVVWPTAAAADIFSSSSIHSVSMVDFFRESSCGLLGGVWLIYSSLHLLLLMIQNNCSCETIPAPQNKWQNTAKCALHKLSQANNCIINNGT